MANILAYGCMVKVSSNSSRASDGLEALIPRTGERLPNKEHKENKHGCGSKPCTPSEHPPPPK